MLILRRSARHRVAKVNSGSLLPVPGLVMIFASLPGAYAAWLLTVGPLGLRRTSILAVGRPESL